MNTSRINQSLAEISQKVHNLRLGTLGNNVDLVGIMRTTKALYVELTSDIIISGYRTDAIAQIQWVHELIEEAGLSLDQQSLQAISMAAELAVSKINDYQEMCAFAEQTGNEKE
jgi:hypothetical protein